MSKYSRAVKPLYLLLFLTILTLIRPSFENVTMEKVEGIYQQQMSTFLLVSTVKTCLAVMEGSTVGFSFVVKGDLQVGDAFQTVYDFVDRIWEMLFYSLLLVTAYKTILETGLMNIFLYLAWAGFALSEIYL